MLQFVSMELSIIIPVYNEAKYIDRFVSQLVKKLNHQNFDYELIISENGSKDDTLLQSKKLTRRFKRVRLISNPEPNYGLGVKSGFLSAKGNYIVLFDLDYWDIPFIVKTLPMMTTYDAIVGAKRGRGSKDTRPILRKLSTLVFSSILKIFFGMKISDTHGIKILNRKKFTILINKCRMTKEIFDTELLIRGEYEGFKISEIGVKVVEKRSSRTSIIKRAFRTIRDLYQLKTYLNREYGQL
jgi:glycosyltransferase involved in cell wall biosynthesis